jgi:isoleucyl-tRNA synthetase
MARRTCNRPPSKGSCDRCRSSVRAYVEEWERLTARIGFWVDSSDAYWTMDPEYVRSVWWHLRRLCDDGLLFEDTKVVPCCPRCETALSSGSRPGRPG